MKQFAKYLSYLILQVTICLVFVTPVFGSEKECRELSGQLLKIRPQVEKLQEESGSQSLLVDKAKRLKHLSKTGDAIKSLEVITAKSEKAGCSQYSWFGRTKEEQNQKTWCKFSLEDGFTPTSNPEDLRGKWPTCECNLTGAQVAEESESHEPKETKDPSGKVVAVSAYSAGQLLTNFYYRDHAECKKREEPFAAKIKELNEAEKNKTKKYD